MRRWPLSRFAKHRAAPSEPHNSTTERPRPFGIWIAISPSGVGYTSRCKGVILCISLSSRSALLIADLEGVGNPSSRAYSADSCRSVNAAHSSGSSEPSAADCDQSARDSAMGCLLLAGSRSVCFSVSVFHIVPSALLDSKYEDAVYGADADGYDGKAMRDIQSSATLVVDY